jgi:hypothetical protein
MGVLVSIAGVAMALAPKLSASHPGHWWGELAVAASAAIGALCTVLIARTCSAIPPCPCPRSPCWHPCLFLALLALGEQWPARLHTFSGQAWAAIVFIGVSSAIGYFWWLYALKHESPTRVTVFLALNPLTAALLGWALLGEALHPAALGRWHWSRPDCGWRRDRRGRDNRRMSSSPDAPRSAHREAASAQFPLRPVLLVHHPGPARLWRRAGRRAARAGGKEALDDA